MAHNFCDDSKSANVMTAVELSRRSHGKIKAYSLHPGLIFTNINREEDTLDAFAEYGILAADGGPNLANEWKTIPEGSATTVVAAFDPSLATRLIPYRQTLPDFGRLRSVSWASRSPLNFETI